MRSLLALQIDGRLFGLSASAVLEVIDLEHLRVSPIPFLPPFLLGAGLWREVALPVIDLGRILDPHPRPEPRRRAVVTGTAEQPAALLACDAVAGTYEDESAIEPLASDAPLTSVTLGTQSSPFGSVTVLCLDRLLSGAQES